MVGFYKGLGLCAGSSGTQEVLIGNVGNVVSHEGCVLWIDRAINW